MRRTKIVATLGPATDAPEMLEQVLKYIDVVRVNFSHGEPEEHQARVEAVRATAARIGRYVAVLGDLQGPKIRVARFANGPIKLAVGDRFTLNMTLSRDAGDQQQVGVDYPQLADDVVAGDTLLLDDGRIQLKVDEVVKPEVRCTVTVGGKLSNNKGINKQGGGLSAAALTEKDKRDLQTAIALKMDYLAVSFPRTGDDMREARALLGEAGKEIGLIAKVERAESVSSDEIMNDLISASEGVMVARGDLGVEIGDAQLIGVQKRLIQRARSLNKVVITATQMMESMISSPLPTRAEVFDVANAVLDGTDAVMLSAETAVGQFPLETVQAMDRLCRGAELERVSTKSNHRMHENFGHINEAVALSAMYAANHLKGLKAIVCMTRTGLTPLLMSRIRSGIPIFAFTSNVKTQHRVALYRGVTTIPFNTVSTDPDALQKAIDELKVRQLVEIGDSVIVTRGGQAGTNTMTIVRIS
ncbi:pyruvate kinase [Oceanospirillum multiglobuliferum]|uniref:Pyruvate kinase n=1 Tax=Oceanospirillum multiglobuliferum TaxID=64969 RepID=A0A1T4MKV3_9GAMM|nr:pyruvate kinase [Oceanospirillum multiglobuliferum]OPX56989.1 pyruvate kinase [Oceanospirillum multiglobuliferum]SJZ67445.1 pyruvate kinase [Oceanospirillum multiglobuliferum]